MSLPSEVAASFEETSRTPFSLLVVSPDPELWALGNPSVLAAFYVGYGKQHLEDFGVNGYDFSVALTLGVGLEKSLCWYFYL